MKKKVLIITVGGSDEPVVSSIKAHNPDFIYFICSGGDPKTATELTVDGKSNVCIRKKEIKCPHCKKIVVEEESYPSIIEQSGYKGEYEKIVLSDPDDFTEVYQKTKEALLKATETGEEIIADFTGGTKTMSSVLAILTAFNFKVKPSIVKGKRTDTESIKTNSITVIENFESARIDFVLKIVNDLFSRYLYFPVRLIIEEMLRMGGISGENQRKLININSIAKAFCAWDTFDYDVAFEILKNYASTYSDHVQYLLKILGKTKNSNYEKVFDLISNARRQAYNGFYDNAIARLYRAIELFAQIRLQTKYEIDTSHFEKFLPKLEGKIDVEKWKKYANEDGEIKLGLIKAYELLMEIKDEIGEVYRERKKELLEKIKIRNESKLAHGDTPIKQDDWEKMYNFCKEFIEECCNKINVKIEYIELPQKIQC